MSNNKRRSYKVLDEPLADPLSDFTDVSSFDIIQFLAADNTTPVDSPVDPNNQEQIRNQRTNVQNNNDLSHLPLGQTTNLINPNSNQILNHPPNMQNNYMNHRMNLLPVTHLMYQNNGRLPDSPPITDISGNGSSASPSSNSDPPYSPDTYSSYSGGGAQNQNSNHQSLILGVHDLHNGLMVAPQEQMQMYPRQLHNPMNVNDGNYIVPQYAHDPSLTQIPEIHPGQSGRKNLRRQNYQLSGSYPQDQALYTMLGSQDQFMRKRPRLDDDIEEMDEKNPYLLESPPLTAGVNSMSMSGGMPQDPQSGQYGMAPAQISTPPSISHTPQSGPSPPCGQSGNSLPANAQTHSMPQKSVSPDSAMRQQQEQQLSGNGTATKILQSGGGEYSQSINMITNRYAKAESHLPHNPVIKFSKFEEDKWLPLYDAERNELEKLQVHVVADKGFNFSTPDQCFVNQKKNHFQISVHIEAIDNLPPVFVKKDGHLIPIKDFKLVFCGVKSEMPSCEIQIKQSQNDRKPINHDPVTIKIIERQMTKVTVPRLHYQDTTMNNQRKGNRPNPEQKYFLLVIRLVAQTEDGQIHIIQSYQSEKVIVRATNPGSFEPPEVEVQWQRNGSLLYTQNTVAIGSDISVGDAKLNVHGDIYHVGKVITPSDFTLKENFTEKDCSQALENVRKLHVVGFSYKPEIAEKWGLPDSQRHKTGLIAQELAAILPEAVHDIGDYLTVDENRVFYETLMATKELCRLTGDLDSKIDDKVEEISARLATYARRKKLLSTSGTNLTNTDIDSKSVLSLSSVVSSNVFQRRRQCRSSCRRPDPICNSKITQGTVVALVFVMTACLLAMSGLYILDWYNRNFSLYYGQNSRSYPSGNDRGEDPPGQMIVPYGMSQPDAPPLVGSLCPEENCYSYCCHSSLDFMESILPAAAAHDEFHFHYQMDLMDMRRPDYGMARAMDPNIFADGVGIEIPSLNTTIDGRYCVEGSCSPKRNSYNLYIPVSPYLPTISIDLRFKIPKGKIVNNCGYLADFENRHCSADSTPSYENGGYPTSYPIDEITYELSVGQYLQSAYRFRIGFTTESCFETEDNMPGSYDEYNLVFYRTCTTAVADDN
ncbi:unnamed protein product [Auanema sp. JU1783]|nr:unnamed protein product [Auanema sp. JU1783]